jgi:hypothetical protein
MSEVRSATHVKPKPLKLFNGRWHSGTHGAGHAYVAAYSKDDAVRVITEALGYEPRGMMSELNTYWSHDCWGNTMDGITPERGLWICKPHGQPVRQVPK